MTDDPITQAYKRLLDLVANHSAVAKVFKPKNIPSLADGTLTPVKNSVQDADFPELLLAPTGGSFGIGYTNTDHKLVKRFSFRMATGTLNVNTKFFPAQFALFTALASLRRKHVNLDLPNVTRVNFMDTTDAIVDDPEAKREKTGWVTLLTVELIFSFTDKDLGIS